MMPICRGSSTKRRSTPEDWIKAAALYEEARRSRPGFSDAPQLSSPGCTGSLSTTSRSSLLWAVPGKRCSARSTSTCGQAEKHPSATYYQVLAELYLWQQKSEEAIGAAERAIALDPSDAYAYEEKSLALSINGRPTEALAQLDIARQVDPNLSSRRGFLAALAYFGLDRFADAIAVLQEADPNATEAWKYEVEIAAPCIGRRTPWRCRRGDRIRAMRKTS